MGVEIERKFLVNNDAWKSAASEGESCIQGYILNSKEKTVRVRVIGTCAYLTVKGKTSGITRAEFEYKIPVHEAESMLALCEHKVEKTRYRINHAGMVWELDVFSGENAGLVMAEIELESEDQPFDLPRWAGQEVSTDPRYYNAALSINPFRGWTDQ